MCKDGLEPSLPEEIGEKPKDENQVIQRVESEAHGPLHCIVINGCPEALPFG